MVLYSTNILRVENFGEEMGGGVRTRRKRNPFINSRKNRENLNYI